MLVCKHFPGLERATEWVGKALNGKFGELSSGPNPTCSVALGEAFPLQASLWFSVNVGGGTNCMMTSPAHDPPRWELTFSIGAHLPPARTRVHSAVGET